MWECGGGIVSRLFAAVDSNTSSRPFLEYARHDVELKCPAFSAPSNMHQIPNSIPALSFIHYI